MFEPTGFSLKILKARYSFTDSETWQNACLRVARQMSLAEIPEKQKTYESKFYDILVNNYFVPGGRIWYNSGRNNPQLLNCFILDPNKDSKEGWGNTAKNTIITSMTGGGVGDDFSDVRPRGASISNQKGESPGPIELMKLVNGCAPPIKAGGGRRVAFMFSLDLDHPDVIEFLDSKLVKGELEYANISVRSKNTKEFIKAVKEDGDWELSWKGKYKKTIKARDLWKRIYTNAYNSAEPGFLNLELAEKESNISYLNKLVTSNPCQPSFASVLTPMGIKTFGDIEIGSTIWSGNNWTKVINKWSNGIKPVYKYETTTGSFIGTENHKIVQNGEKLEVKNAESIDWVVGPIPESEELNSQDIMDGLVIGDGSVHKASNNLIVLYIGEKDKDYFSSEISDYLLKYRPGVSKECYEIKSTIIHSELPKTFDRKIPDRFYFGSNKTKMGFLRGLFSANGSLCGDRITLKQSSKVLINQVQEMLSSLGIHSYITINKPQTVSWKNGIYESKQSYTINITSGRTIFKNNIGFIQKYKQDNIKESNKNKNKTSDIKSIEYLGDYEVFDITVDDNKHTYWTGGCLVSNCGEIIMSPFESCCLGHIVLHRFIKNNEIDYPFLGKTIHQSIRFLDNVLTVNSYPLPEMKEVSHRLRRIGLGVTGLADTLAILGYKYGSEEGNKFLDKVYRFISKASYEASIMLAIEKGMYPGCNPEKHLESDYMKRMPSKIRSLIGEHGIRNCALLTQAPCGTVSILSGNCSSGIEPMYSAAYERKFWDKDERKTELVFHPLFEQFMKEGRSVDHFIGSHDLSVRDHLEVQKVVQKHIDNAVSKTINIKNDYSIDEMQTLWLEYLPHLKGTTFYREGTRGYVNEKGEIEEPPLKAIPLEEAKKRFNEIHKVEAEHVDDCPNGVCSI